MNILDSSPPLEIWRFVVQIGMLYLLWRLGNYMKRLFDDGQSDRAAREETISELKDSATALAERTAKILLDSEARVDVANQHVQAALAGSANQETLKHIETNTKNTADAADALKNAADDLKNGKQ